MSEKTRKILVFGVLVLALVWAYFNFTGPKKDRASKAGRDGPTTVIEPRNSVSAATRIPDSLYQQYETKAWGRNPFYHGFQPYAESGPIYSDEVSLQLLGVVFREYMAHALINGNIVTVGGEIEGFRVTKIFRDSVLLDNGEEIITLRVTKESS